MQCLIAGLGEGSKGRGCPPPLREIFEYLSTLSYYLVQYLASFEVIFCSITKKKQLHFWGELDGGQELTVGVQGRSTRKLRGFIISLGEILSLSTGILWFIL